MTRRPRYKSSIPARAKERVISRHPDGTKARTEYTVGRSVVGHREWDEDGLLSYEWPERNGRNHGVEYEWARGRLVSAEPWESGVQHGVTRQWRLDGRRLGTYAMRRGTGLDLWRQEHEDGTPYLSEVLYLKDGRRRGFQWFINEDQETVHVERHWLSGQLHGVWREWDTRGRLEPGYPQ
jgi:antitoxin component YwqK of YwqJK toxin-antitoxin module